MRILMVNYEYPPLGGGGGVAAANQARELVRQGHAVDYITSHFEGLEREEVQHGVRIFRERVIGRTGLQTASIVSMLSFPLVAIRRGMQLARAQAYDIVHTHFAIPSGPAGYCLSRRLGVPNLLSVYGGDIYDPSKRYSPHRQPVLKWTVKRVLNQAGVVVPESQDLCERAAAIYHPRTPIECIPLGFVPAAFEPVTRADLGLVPERRYAIAVSRLVARKGYPDLLEAFAKAAVPELDLLIVGDGPEEAPLRTQVEAMGLTERVRFLGHASDEQKYQYLSCADFFVLASLHEGFGIVFQEAMYCGLPIATTNNGGQTDFLTHDVNALLSSPGDPKTLAEHIRRLATDDALRARIGAENREAIKSHLIETVVQSYVQLYERCLER